MASSTHQRGLPTSSSQPGHKSAPWRQPLKKGLEVDQCHTVTVLFLSLLCCWYEKRNVLLYYLQYSSSQLPLVLYLHLSDGK